jgi:hypothetical protein
MPRVKVETTEEALAPAPKKRAPRKRAESASVAEAVPRVRAPRKRALPIAREESKEVSSESVRRAPTPLRAEAQVVKKGRRALIVALIVAFLITGTGVGIGLTDRGEIDVVAVVNERNERIHRGEVREGESSITIPVQNTDSRPNGGLVPIDPSQIPNPTPASEAVTSNETTATTTETTATTTESVSAEATASTTENGTITDV